MADQELSLFHDAAPLVPIMDLQCSLPSSHILWAASSPENWLASVESLYGDPTNLTNRASIPSLFGLFQDFLHGDLSCGKTNISVQQLRLLLYPLQSLIYHLRQVLSCFPGADGTSRATSRAHSISNSSTLLRLEEVQSQLQSWYELANNFQKGNPDCNAISTNLVLYHLISLNMVVDFPEIERLAREFERTGPELMKKAKACIPQREDAVLHSGQVLRHLHLIPVSLYPPWWSAALYRAVLVLWAHSVSQLGRRSEPNRTGGGDSAAAVVGNRVRVDRVAPEDSSLVAYLWSADGLPVLTSSKGEDICLDRPDEVLDYGVKTLNEAAVSSGISDGIKRKLATLWGRWVLGGFNADAA